MTADRATDDMRPLSRGAEEGRGEAGPARLLVDIGGTNARFAVQAGPGAPIVDEQVYRCADHDGVQALVEHYLRDGTTSQPAECAIGIASPVGADDVVMTNLHWRFSIAALRTHFGWRRFKVINDFTALALALPTLEAGELAGFGPGAPVAGKPVALIGPGTGLGVGGLLPAPGGGWSAIAGEGGHVTLAGANDREDAILAEVRREFGHASAERVLCGPGLVNLHCAAGRVDGRAAAGGTTSAPPASGAADAAGTDLSPADIVERALARTDPACEATLALFLELLGSAAGNLALTLGAQGGVYLGGGILPRLGDHIATSGFRARFEAKGRYEDYLRAIPTWVIHAASPPALRGAAQALDLPGD